MSKVKEITKISVILFLITAISALLLALVNNITAPMIAANEEQSVQDALRVVMPEADRFEARAKGDVEAAA